MDFSAPYRPALVLLTSTGMSREGYEGRISANERHVKLSAVTGADEGSYTVRDAEGVIQRKFCLNVRGESTNEDQRPLLASSDGSLKTQTFMSVCVAVSQSDRTL